MFIHTEIYGHGEPLLLIHGWAMHSGIWRSFAKQLAEHYHVICVDLPGHGHSEKLPVFTLEAISNHLQKILPHSGCTLIGWSLGGLVALDLASRFPNQIKNIVMIGSNPYFVKTQTWTGIKQITLEKFAHELTIDCHGTLLRFLALQVKGLCDYKLVLKTLKNEIQTCQPPDTEILQGGLNILRHQDLRPQLARLSCRMQLILGNHDTLVPVAVAEQMQALNSRLNVQFIDKAGHVPFLSHSAQTIDILKNFLESVDAV